MGFFGGDNDESSPGQNQANELATEQLEQNQQGLETKKQNLYAARLDILKGQGGQSWVPDRSRRAPTSPGGAGGRGSGGAPFPFPWHNR